MIKTSKKNLLIITLSPPLPANSGAPIYVTNTLLPLADQYNLHLYTIGGEAEVAHIEKHRKEYDKYFSSVHVEPRAQMPSQKTTGGRILHTLEHMVHGLPFMDASYYSRAAVQSARRIVREHKIDAMEIHSSHLAFFKKFLPKTPALLVSHNIESDIFPFWVPQNLSGWKKSAVELAAKVSRRNAHDVECENKWHFEAMTFISNNDMGRVTAPVEKHYIPLCLPIKEVDYTLRPASPVNLLWMGGFWWYPNAEGALWFVREILPLVRHKLQQHNIQIHFLGAAPPDELKAADDGKHVHVHGFVESLDDVLASTHLLFVPLLSGGGVRVKILEAMSNGIPVISTSKGCEGLGATDGENIVIRDTPEAFAASLIELALDQALRSRLSVSCRKLLDEKYNLQHCIDIKATLYKKITTSR
ncbi:glycosyltransferase family 4 protein [Pseudomonas multiresinivorans]|uniref:Glycosyltransferase family 4 protein n=2 Tax=Pseudomonas multiresinivorans TaxID=95301 RepID=A0A7Z3BRX6_9PSED|nr:glycosyltransferase family 4 protein [Pseudomonas multiresinivorans]